MDNVGVVILPAFEINGREELPMLIYRNADRNIWDDSNAPRGGMGFNPGDPDYDELTALIHKEG